MAYPLGSFLDWLLGKHGAKRFPKKDLKALIELHQITKQNSKKNESDIPDTNKTDQPDNQHNNAHQAHNLVFIYICEYEGIYRNIT